ncbi:MAG: Fe-S protein assembly co-chaperone HscB [Actinobacteria bacterium RBG_16_67_10]|nr:MAG: Fe-S protein assembly co-chaperone HscB [Actinobacteria bacterium RBG_16_67_10]OGK85581.1 MAG: Fe-S protein assembly co-chaperone HscB [Candidatus Rokubacteria bacterium GWC2_70_16]
MNDYFAVFGLPRKLRLDGEELQRRFYELSRVHHPDFHQGASEEAQARALSASALVNRAYRALRDPLGRVEYLVALEEGREGAATKPRAPMDLLEEMLEVQEALQEARAAGLDEASRQRLDAERQRLMARRASEEEAIAARAAAWDAAVDGQGDRQGLLDWFTQRLAARAYLGTVIEDLSDALGEGEEGHVSHRRH